MPLVYDVTETLAIPDHAFNADDIATLLVNGSRYGGRWVLNAWVWADGRPSEAPIGEIATVADERPSMAVDTAYIWVNDACVKAGLRLARFDDRSHEYGPDERPFFVASLVYVDRRGA